MSQLSGFIEFSPEFSFCVIGYVVMKTVVLIYSSLLSAQLFITVFEAGNVLFCSFIFRWVTRKVTFYRNHGTLRDLDLTSN